MSAADKAFLQCHLVAFYTKATCNQKQWTNQSGTELNSGATPLWLVPEIIQREIKYPCCPQEGHIFRETFRTGIRELVGRGTLSTQALPHFMDEEAEH